jgi:hypothetical protein
MPNYRPTSLGDVDPATVDAASSPKPKRRRRKVQPMPKLLEPWADKARARMEQRPASPGIILERTGVCDEFEPASPHDNDEVWHLQIHDAFATRSPSAVRVFIEQLRALCGQHWSDREGMWRPSETELNAALNFVNSVQPKNEAEAALAAQMVAVHLMTMRVSAQALKLGDPRSASVAGKLARTYAIQLDTLNRIRGMGRSSRQRITVRHEKHVHTHQHVHLEGGGSDLRGQPHEARKGSSVDKPRACELEGRGALRSSDTTGNVVPLPGDARPIAMQATRRESDRSAKG